MKEDNDGKIKEHNNKVNELIGEMNELIASMRDMDHRLSTMIREGKKMKKNMEQKVDDAIRKWMIKKKE